MGQAWYSWGADDAGQAAQPDPSPATIVDTPAASDFPTAPTISTVGTCGEVSGIGIASDGTLYGWGETEYQPSPARGPFGDDLLPPVSGAGGTLFTATQLPYADAADVVQVCTSIVATFWRKSDGSVWAVGLNSHGAFGTGEAASTYHAAPVHLTQLSNIVWIEAGNGSNCLFAIDNGGTLWFSGDASWGLDGSASNAGDILTSTAVTLSGTPVAVSCDAEFALALMDDGTVQSWGRNHHGQLGQGSISGSTVRVAPGAVSGLSNITQVHANGGVRASTFLDGDGVLYVCGEDFAGYLGLGTTPGDQATATSVSVGGKAIASIATGRAHFSQLVVTADGGLWGCGQNNSHQLDNTGSQWDTFAQVHATEFPTGSVQAAALVGDNAVFVLKRTGSRVWVALLP